MMQLVIYLLCLALYFFSELASIRYHASAQALCKEYDLYSAPVSLLHGSEGRSDNVVFSDSERRACKYKLEITQIIIQKV